MQTYGLIGYPLGHSFSAKYFTAKFYAEHIEATYRNFEIPTIDLLPDIIRKNPTLKGLNVTIPYKETVIPLLDELSDEAKSIGAVNVIKIIRKGYQTRLIGYNADIIGFTQSIRPLLKPHHKQALVLGTGGASKAVTNGLRQLGLNYLYVSRHQRPDGLIYPNLTPDFLKTYPVVVNCTPLGMYPRIDTCPDIPYEALNTHNLLYDLVYNPQETLFLKQGKQQGAVTKNGLEMLHLQAEASWSFWNQEE